MNGSNSAVSQYANFFILSASTMMFFPLMAKYAPITKYTFIEKPGNDGIIPVKYLRRNKPRKKTPK